MPTLPATIPSTWPVCVPVGSFRPNAPLLYVDVFVIAGQSNAVGQGGDTASPAAPNGLFVSAGGVVSSPLADPVGNANTGSMWPAFANEWYAQTGRRPAFVEAAVSGTGLLPDASGGWSPAGTLRALAVTAANTAIAAVPSAGYNLGNVYFLWCQGEQDATTINGTTITGPLYKSALQVLADYFKAQVPSMNTMAVIQTGGPAKTVGSVMIMDATMDNWLAIRQAQADAVAADSANLRMAYLGLYSFPSIGKQNNGLHMKQIGYNTAGTCAARQLATGATPAAIAPFLSSTNYVDTNYTTGSTRTDSHTTSAGTTMVIVALAACKGTNNSIPVPTVTFGGVNMLLCAQVHAFTFSDATQGLAQSLIYYIDATTFGSTLDGITQNIVSTTSSAVNIISLCAIDAKDVGIVDATAGKFPSPTAGTNATATIDVFAPSLVVTCAVSSAAATTALTCTLTNSTKVMDSGATNGTTNSVQMAVGYSVESAPIANKAIIATWSAACLSIAIASVSFRAKVSGE